MCVGGGEVRRGLDGEGELAAHAVVGVVDEGGELSGEGRGKRTAGDEFFGVDDRVFAETGVGVGEGGENGRFGECAEAIEDAEGVMFRERRLRFADECGEQGSRGFVLTFVEETRSGVAVPAVRVCEGGDEFGGRGGAEGDARAAVPAVRRGDDTIDATAVVAVVEVEVLLDFLRDAPRVLDDFAIHVADVEGAVGGVGKIHDADPRVGAGGEFEVLFVGRTATDEAHAIGVDFFAMDQLAAGIAGEGVIDEVVAVGIATENGRACGAGEIAAHATAALDGALDDATDPPARAHDAPGFVGADAIHLGGAPIGGDALAGGRQAEERVSRRVTIIVNEELEVVGIRAGEFAAVVVEAHAVLRAAGFKTEGVGAWIKPEVAGAKFFGGQIGALRTVNQPAVAEAAHEVDAVVLAPGETAEHGLDVEGF